MNLTNKLDAIQEATHQEAVDTIVVEDVDEEKENEDDDNNVIPPSMLGRHSHEDSVIKSEDKEELPPVPPTFGGGQYPGCHRTKKLSTRLILETSSTLKELPTSTSRTEHQPK